MIFFITISLNPTGEQSEYEFGVTATFDKQKRMKKIY